MPFNSAIQVTNPGPKQDHESILANEYSLDTEGLDDLANDFGLPQVEEAKN
jgi:hypothetical protein